MSRPQYFHCELVQLLIDGQEVRLCCLHQGERPITAGNALALPTLMEWHLEGLLPRSRWPVRVKLLDQFAGLDGALETFSRMAAIDFPRSYQGGGHFLERDDAPSSIFDHDLPGQGNAVDISGFRDRSNASSQTTKLPKVLSAVAFGAIDGKVIINLVGWTGERKQRAGW
jgi:hypothetical protein